VGNATGSNNVAIGTQAMFVPSALSDITAVGFSALRNNLGTGNLAVGYAALSSAIGATGSDNIAIGRLVLGVLSSGARNTVMGTIAGDAITSGNNNTLIGFDAGGAITTGASNTAVGQDALGNASGASKSNNTAIGSDAGNNITTGNNNTLVGSNADTDTTGRSDCIILGRNSGTSAVGLLDGSLVIGDAMANLLSATAGGSSGQHLVIYLNNTQYKIKLENP
jgi:hypothetical protein